MANKPFNVGDVVLVTIDAGWLKLDNARGTIVFMDNAVGLHRHEFCPVQVELDEPYDKHGQRMIRVTLMDVKRCEE